jgi:DNA-binding transcriptional LysR family regulator
MELHQLQYLVAVTEESSFSRAAERLGIAQPSLSQQIKKLEQALGQPLLDRLPRRVVPNDPSRVYRPFERDVPLREINLA